jgi:hypothetical protein
MEVTLRVNGISSSGNRYDTNDATLDFDILPETYVEPTTGDETDAPEATPTVVAAAFSSEIGDEDDLGRLDQIFN